MRLTLVAVLWGTLSFGQDELFSAYQAAESVEERVRAGERLAHAGADFSVIHARLRTGRSYRMDVETGRVEWSRDGTGGRHEVVVLVPEDYDPSTPYRVCFYLHGGVNQPDAPRRGDSWWRRFDRFEGVDQISVFPASWRGSLWWQPSQIENLEAILDRIKSIYNVDENRVFLFGVSDGGTGVYYFAMKASTPWAAYFPFIGHPAVLSNPSTGVRGEMFEANLVNRPLYIVSGETDRLYPASRVRPYVDAFREEGATVVFRPLPGGHNTRWWNAETARIDAFATEHPRDPLPERLSWETDEPALFGRFAWVVIDTLSGDKRARGVFVHSKPSGRVVIDRRGNSIEIAADGVRRFTLLLAPDEVDFDEPIQVTTNGAVSFSGQLERSVATLLKWAARDNDRTMLFGAELTITLD